MESRDFSLRLGVALLLTGLLAGLVGIGFTHLLHAVQQLVFHGGWAQGGHASFRELVQQASAARRFVALLACGAVVGVCWTLLQKYGAPLMEVKTAVKQPEKDMPVKTTACHAILQIITVGMGSPLGREVAPREMSVALATPLSGCLNLSPAQKSVVLACASGAGLAAVYNVPLAATVFVLETLLVAWSVPMVLAALLACGVAVLVVRVGLGDTVQYAHLPNLENVVFDAPFLAWAAVCGVLIALGVNAFAWSNGKLPKLNKASWKMLPIALLSFAAIGAMGMWQPEILGNGKAGNQLSFADALTWQTASALLATKWAAVLLASLAGAYGGRITPSIILGGRISVASAVAWDAGRDDCLCQRGGLECGVAARFGGGGGVCGGNGVFGLGAKYAADGGGVYGGTVAVEHGVLAARLRVYGGGDGGADGLGTVEGGAIAGDIKAA